MPYMPLLVLICLTFSCSRSFEKNFSSVAVNCGLAEGAYRPVDAEGRAISSESLEALTVDADGSRKVLNFTSKGCVHVPQDFVGAIVFRNKKKGLVGFIDHQSSSRKAIVDVPLENFPLIKPKLLCSGQDIWTNQPFAQIEWEFYRDSQTLTGDRVRHLLPLLNVKILSRAADGQPLQELTLSRSVSVPELAGQEGRFAWQFQVPTDDQAQIELQLQDILDRTEELKGPSSCRVHMSTKKPKLLTSNDRSLLVGIQQGSRIALDTFDDAQLFVQVKPITAISKVSRWDNLSDKERKTERATFRPGRSPMFWQTGTYILRAYTENKAKNQSAVWERVIQVQESPLIDHQVTLTHWVLQGASKRGGPALINVQYDNNGPLMRLRSLDAGFDEGLEEWRPQISNEAHGLFQNGFNISRHLIEGRFGFGNSTLTQTCLIRGSHPSDAWRESFAGRLLCWQRTALGQLEIIADQEAPFLEEEGLHTMPVGGNQADEILAFSQQNRGIRIMRVTAQGLQELNSFSDGAPKEAVFVATVAGPGEPGYLVRTAVGQQIIALSQVIRDPIQRKPLSVMDISFAPSKVDYYSDSWGPNPDVPERLHSMFERTSTRMQALPTWKDQQPTMIYSNIRYHSRWARHIFTDEHRSSLLLSDASFEGLPSNISDTCFFVGMRCLAYHDEPRSRSDVRIYDFNSTTKKWIFQTVIDLQTLAATETLLESPRPAANVVNIAFGSSYQALAPKNGQLHWKVTRLNANDTVVHQGTGTLQLWGRDERFEVHLEVRDAANQVIRSEVRDLRFEGSPVMGVDLNHGLGLVDLKGQGVPYLIQPESQGFAALELGLNPSVWISLPAPLPDFVRADASGLGWNSRPISFVSGRLIAGRDHVFCYVAAAVSGKAGAISCYGWNGNRLDAVLSSEFPLAEGQEIAAVQINGTDRTALMVLDRIRNEFRAYLLEPGLRQLPWVLTRTTSDNRVEKVEESSFFMFRENHAEIMVRGTLHFANGADLEPGILHFGGQVQLGTGNNRFALVSRFTTQVTGGRLQKARTEELALDMDPDAMDMQPNEYRRMNVFHNFDFTWMENPGSDSLYTTLGTRGGYGNSAFSQEVDGIRGCRVEGIFGSEFLVTGIVNCNPFMVQSEHFANVLMDTYFDLNEEYLAQPDKLATHWSLPYWIPDPAPTADPRQLPVVAMLLRIPKNYQKDGWMVQRASYDFPLRDQGESWSTLRMFSLGAE